MGKLILPVVVLGSALSAQAVTYWSIFERNYTGNVPATDRDWFYRDEDGDPMPEGDGQYPSLEYETGRSFGDITNVVYVKNSAINVTLKIRNSHPNNITGNLNITAARLKVPVGPGRPTVTYITLTPPASQSVSINGGGGTQTVNLSFSGTPNYVTTGQLEVQWTVQATSGVPSGTHLLPAPIGWGGWDATNFYFIHGSPQHYQSVPWTDLLAYACSYAHGETTTAGVAGKVTYGIFWGQMFAYNLGSETINDHWVEGDEEPQEDPVYFLLRDYLDELEDDGIQPGNCEDVSSFTHLAFAALGVSSDVKRTNNFDGYLTWPVCPIGSDATQSNLYYHLGFGMHQQAWVYYDVYDASLAYFYDLGGSTHKEPAMGWTYPGYWQSSYYGLCYRSVDPLIDTPYLTPYLHWVPDSMTGPASTPVTISGEFVVRVK